MAIISKITVQKNNKNRYNIYMDDGKREEYAFSVDEDVLIKYNLKKGFELDEFSITEIHFQDDIRKAYNTAIQFLSRRMRTEKEVRNHLIEKEMDEPLVQEAIFKLYEYNFLNDEEYALSYVRTQMNTTDKGADLIKRELREKGVSEQYIEAALQDYPLDSQMETAKMLAEKFIEKNKRDSDRVIKQKVEQLLLRKGFGFDVIPYVIEMLSFSGEDEEMVALRYQGEKLIRKYSNLSGFEYNQKVKQALFSKGFSLESIERYLNLEDD